MVRTFTAARHGYSNIARVCGWLYGFDFNDHVCDGSRFSNATYSELHPYENWTAPNHFLRSLRMKREAANALANTIAATGNSGTLITISSIKIIHHQITVKLVVQKFG